MKEIVLFGDRTGVTGQGPESMVELKGDPKSGYVRSMNDIIQFELWKVSDIQILSQMTNSNNFAAMIQIGSIKGHELCFCLWIEC